MKELPFKSCFANLIIRPLVAAEKDKYLALASLADVSKFLPTMDTVENHDLLPVAFNACVVNRVNKNGDVIDTKTALAMYKNFIHKPINVEHHRQQIIGMILTAGFSEFGTDKPLTEEQVTNMTDPFNITLGGIVWRLVAPDLSDLIEDASDPTSANHLAVSASWELGFTGYEVVLMEGGKKNLTEAKRIITDEKEISEIQDKLVALGGDGKFNDLFAYRKPSEEVLPVGIGFTETPAAEVKGVATAKNTEGSESDNAEASTEVGTDISQSEAETCNEHKEIDGCSCAECVKKQNNISQSSLSNVKTERTPKSMNITSLQDISEASLKDVAPSAVASAVSEFISSELKKGNDSWLKEKSELNNKLQQAEAAGTEAKAELEKVQKQVSELTEQVTSLSNEKIEREKVEKFNSRMSAVSEAFELDDEVRSAIVDDIKAIASDEDFDKWMTKAKILLKGYAKKAKGQMKEDEEEMGEKECASKKAKANEEKDAKASAVNDAIDNADKDKGGLPNGSEGTKTLRDKAQVAFAKENIIVK